MPGHDRRIRWRRSRQNRRDLKPRSILSTLSDDSWNGPSALRDHEWHISPISPSGFEFCPIRNPKLRAWDVMWCKIARTPSRDNAICHTLSGKDLSAYYWVTNRTIKVARSDVDRFMEKENDRAGSYWRSSTVSWRLIETGIQEITGGNWQLPDANHLTTFEIKITKFCRALQNIVGPRVRGSLAHNYVTLQRPPTFKMDPKWRHAVCYILHPINGVTPAKHNPKWRILIVMVLRLTP